MLAIAAVFVFREAARDAEEPPDAVFDPDDALRLGGASTSPTSSRRRSPRTDVERILGLPDRVLPAQGRVAQRHPHRSRGRPGRVRLPEEAVDYILERCAATGEAYLPEQVEAVMECQLDYLRFIGAIGREADEA